MAAAMVATSVGITARVLQDLKVLKSRAAQIILGAAVFDDILGMVLLAVVVSISSGHGVHWVHLAVVIAEAIGFTLLMIYVGPGVVGRLRPVWRGFRHATRRLSWPWRRAFCFQPPRPRSAWPPLSAHSLRDSFLPTIHRNGSWVPACMASTFWTPFFFFTMERGLTFACSTPTHSWWRA